MSKFKETTQTGESLQDTYRNFSKLQKQIIEAYITSPFHTFFSLKEKIGEDKKGIITKNLKGLVDKEYLESYPNFHSKKVFLPSEKLIKIIELNYKHNGKLKTGITNFDILLCLYESPKNFKYLKRGFNSNFLSNSLGKLEKNGFINKIDSNYFLNENIRAKFSSINLPLTSLKLQDIFEDISYSCKFGFVLLREDNKLVKFTDISKIFGYNLYEYMLNRNIFKVSKGNNKTSASFGKLTKTGKKLFNSYKNIDLQKTISIEKIVKNSKN